jgi:protein SCO1/2
MTIATISRSTLTTAVLLIAILASAAVAFGEQRYPAKGLVLKVDRPRHTIVVSCQSIPGFMDAMVMPFSVKDAKELADLKPGAMIDFTLVVNANSSYAEGIHVHGYQGLEPDPLTARRLKLMNQASDPSAMKPVAIGQTVPDFTLTDQNRQAITLSKFAGKVVALNFIYIRCMLPNFCFRSSNNFGLLQKRFKERLGRDLILLTVTFDPSHDQPEVLSKYASTWKADSKTWHFLTGSAADVRRVCDLFGEDAFQDEGLMTHSLHTAIIDPRGNLAANLEGNEFTAQQLGDLVETELNNTHSGELSKPATQ